VLSRALTLTAALALLGPLLVAPRAPAPGAFPGVVLWAWERPIDLRDLPSGAGVAFLAQTIIIADGSHLVVPRRQPLHVDPSTTVIAVSRIEAPGDAGPADAGGIARAIAETAHLPRVAGVQIDFDARVSQRAIYRRILHGVRAALPPRMPLAMTALASWCLDDNWLDELPVDEAIPMLFRMGPAETVLRQEWPLRTPAAKCRASIGVSLDEPRPSGRKGLRTYVFNPEPWSAPTVTAALEMKR
jgi:hypothetical protein